jgi:hypothetical protein
MEKKCFILSLILILFNLCSSDLLIRSPNELKSQFISMSINNKIILIY